MQYEILEYVAEGMGWLAIGGISYFGTIVGLNGGSKIFSQRIHNQEELDKIVDEEANKLEMDKPVRGIFHYSQKGYAQKNKDGTYEIHVGSISACRASVRHELYHVHKDDFDDAYFQLRYWFLYEPRAIAYEVFRLKL